MNAVTVLAMLIGIGYVTGGFLGEEEPLTLKYASLVSYGNFLLTIASYQRTYSRIKLVWRC